MGGVGVELRRAIERLMCPGNKWWLLAQGLFKNGISENEIDKIGDCGVQGKGSIVHNT